MSNDYWSPEKLAKDAIWGALSTGVITILSFVLCSVITVGTVLVTPWLGLLSLVVWGVFGKLLWELWKSTFAVQVSGIEVLVAVTRWDHLQELREKYPSWWK